MLAHWCILLVFVLLLCSLGYSYEEEQDRWTKHVMLDEMQEEEDEEEDKCKERIWAKKRMLDEMQEEEEEDKCRLRKKKKTNIRQN